MADSFTEYDIAKAILDKKVLIDYRVTPDNPFMGILVNCGWDEKEIVKQTIYKALEAFIK